MSEGEYQLQQGLANDAGRESRPDNGPPGQWRMKSGALIGIQEMDDGHLTNTIKLMFRYTASSKLERELQYANALYGDDPFGPRGDGAWDGVHSELRSLQTEELWDWCPTNEPKLAELMAEANRRNWDLGTLKRYVSDLEVQAAGLALQAVVGMTKKS